MRIGLSGVVNMAQSSEPLEHGLGLSLLCNIYLQMLFLATGSMLVKVGAGSRVSRLDR
jgi:hypothetical protein